jgi:PAS domain S-box-containing protein
MATPLTKASAGTMDFRVFEATPGISVLLYPDAPVFTIAAFSNEFVLTTGRKKENIAGRDYSAAFQDQDGRMRSLLETVTKSKETRSFEAAGEIFPGQGKITVTPVTDDNGSLSYIICSWLSTPASPGTEESFKNIIEQAPVAMCILKGASFLIEIANTRMFGLWGKPAEAVMNKPLFEAVPEAGNQGLEELLRLVYSTGETFRGNERPVIVNRNGELETRYINFVYQPFRETDGSISGVITAAIDVTDQVVSKQNIEERNEELRMAIEIADLGVFRIDLLDDKAIYSQRIMNWFGFTEQQLSLEVIASHVHPDDREQVIEALQKSYISEALSRHDVTYRVVSSIDGTTRHLHSFGKTYFTESGKPYLMVGMIQDVTAQIIYEQQLRESEELLQKRVSERTNELESQKNLLNNILENSSNGISVSEMIRDANGNVIDATTILANEAAVKFTGLPRDIYLSKTARELDPQILSSPYGQTCLKTLATGEPSLIQYYLEVTGKWLELTISKMDDDHLIHIFTDVTPIKEAQLQLERTIEELKRSNTNLEEFAYAASHDMKEPVRKIHFFSDRLKGSLEGRLNEEERRTFERMELASKRMGALIDDLLAYSQVSMLPRHNEKTDLNHILDLVLEDLDLEIEEKRAKITIGKLCTINGYPRQLQQAFQNLISNALKYNKPGEAPEITIEGTKVKGKDLPVKTESPRKEYYSITIRDNGIGFEQKDVDRIFNVFTRLHGNAEYRGTGVGLSIVRKVIENHNGFITAASTPGSGAVFNIYLPADQDENN